MLITTYDFVSSDVHSPGLQLSCNAGAVPSSCAGFGAWSMAISLSWQHVQQGMHVGTSFLPKQHLVCFVTCCVGGNEVAACINTHVQCLSHLHLKSAARTEIASSRHGLPLQLIMPPVLSCLHKTSGWQKCDVGDPVAGCVRAY